MRGHLIKLFLFLLLPSLVFAGAPSRIHTYTAGNAITASQNTANEDAVFTYLQRGVDTLADNCVTTSKILDGTIANADISGSAGITYSKLSLANSILTGDIKDGEIVNADISSSAGIAASKLLLTGITTLTAGGDLDIGSYDFKAQTLTSDVGTGTAPFTVASTTVSTNLNADLLDGQTGAYYTDYNMVFCWVGSDNAATNNYGLYNGTSLTPTFGTYTVNYQFLGVFSTTYQTILTGRFVKIARISTITINAKIWAETTDGGEEAILSVDVGGQSNTVKSTTSSTPTWVTVSTIDVSSLTNGTTYDITVQLKNEAAHTSLCSGLILIGS